MNTPLSVVSVKQPWAGCIARGEKPVENRTWATRHRGPLAIHAGRRVDDDAFGDIRVQRALCGRAGPGCWDAGIVTDPSWTRRGVIVAVAELVDCHAAWRGCCQPWGDPGAFHWVLERVRRLARPVPVRGRLGVFTLADDVARAVGDQLRAVVR